MQTNSSVIALSETSKTLRVIDVPGHPRVRNQFREHLGDAKAIAFVVDASTVSRNGAVVAECVQSCPSAPSFADTHCVGPDICTQYYTTYQTSRPHNLHHSCSSLRTRLICSRHQHPQQPPAMHSSPSTAYALSSNASSRSVVLLRLRESAWRA